MSYLPHKFYLKMLNTVQNLFGIENNDGFWKNLAFVNWGRDCLSEFRNQEKLLL